MHTQYAQGEVEPTTYHIGKRDVHEQLTCEILLTTFCNMACDYCVARELPHVSMIEGLGRKAIDIFLELGEGAKSIEFVFSGGEPFLEFPLFERLVLYAEKRTRTFGVMANFTVKTNGTILNPAIKDFLIEHYIKVF